MPLRHLINLGFLLNLLEFSLILHQSISLEYYPNYIKHKVDLFIFILIQIR